MAIKGFDAWGATPGRAEKPVKQSAAQPAQPAQPAVVKVRRRGRPRIGEVPERPWIAAGMSESTWYRRQREKKDE